MYKEKLLASLRAGEITDLQQNVLRQEFITAVEQEGFGLCQCSRQRLICQHKADNGVYISLVTDQAASGEAETPNTLAWGHWYLSDAAGEPISIGHNHPTQPESGANKPPVRTCSGFWLEGIENIRSFKKAFLRQQL